MNLEKLALSLPLAWSKESSYWPDGWSPENPSYGQCASTARVVQILCGGTIIRGKLGSDSHYWNRFGVLDADFTATQYAGDRTSGNDADLSKDEDVNRRASIILDNLRSFRETISGQIVKLISGGKTYAIVEFKGGDELPILNAHLRQHIQ